MQMMEHADIQELLGCSLDPLSPEYDEGLALQLSYLGETSINCSTHDSSSSPSEFSHADTSDLGCDDVSMTDSDVFMNSNDTLSLQEIMDAPVVIFAAL